jgi:hypothetical protein
MGCVPNGNIDPHSGRSLSAPEMLFFNRMDAMRCLGLQAAGWIVPYCAHNGFMLTYKQLAHNSIINEQVMEDFHDKGFSPGPLWLIVWT